MEKELHAVIVGLLEEELLGIEEIWQDLQELPVDDYILDRVVGLLEDSGDAQQIKLAGVIASGIEAPTLQDDINRRHTQWWENDRCSQHNSHYPKREFNKRWIQLFDRLYPDYTLSAKPTVRKWRSDI